MKTHRERAEEIVGRYPRGGPLKPSAREIADGTYPAELVEAARALLAATDEAADTCDGWAEESRYGGWSTHQVKANRELAGTLRRKGAKLRATLDLYPEADDA